MLASVGSERNATSPAVLGWPVQAREKGEKARFGRRGRFQLRRTQASPDRQRREGAGDGFGVSLSSQSDGWVSRASWWSWIGTGGGGLGAVVVTSRSAVGGGAEVASE